MKKEKPRMRFHVLYLIFAIWGVFFLQNLWMVQNKVTQLPYSEFLNQLKSGNISEVTAESNHLRGILKSAVDGKKEFVTVRLDPEMANLLAQYNVKFSGTIESTFLRDALGWIVPTLIFFALWIFISRSMQSSLSGGFMSLGKSKAKVYVEQDTKTTFKDVAGVNEAKAELQEVVGFLKDPDSYQKLGARTPKGVLLVGPPGTGKTLLAKAIAGEAKVPFFSINGSEFVEMFIGLGAARVRDLFEQASKQAPCIIFIDELDALGKSRNSSIMGGHDEKEQTLNQLLVEMDGFDSRTGIILIAATNRPEILDPALLRAGRFDRQVLVDKPDRKEREDILRVHIDKIRYDKNLRLEQIADLTPGFTGADLANLVNEAAIFATRRKGEFATLSDFTQAFERIVAGLEKRNRVIGDKEKRIIAHHEMGHAFVAASLPGSDTVHKISIIPRSVGALGYTLQRPEGDRFIITEQDLKNKIKILMGGRAAELLIFDHLSTGAADDIQKATNIARDMVMRYGMNRQLGSIAYDEGRKTFLGGPSELSLEPKAYSDFTSKEIDQAVRNIVEDALESSLAILTLNQDLLEEAARELLEKETLLEDDLKAYFSRIKHIGVFPGFSFTPEAPAKDMH